MEASRLFWAGLVVDAVAVYAALGLIVGLYVAWRGAGRLDPAASDAGWGFRLIIVPGCVAFWPLLVWRLRATVGERR